MAAGHVSENLYSVLPNAIFSNTKSLHVRECETQQHFWFYGKLLEFWPRLRKFLTETKEIH